MSPTKESFKTIRNVARVCIDGRDRTILDNSKMI